MKEIRYKNNIWHCHQKNKNKNKGLKRDGLSTLGPRPGEVPSGNFTFHFKQFPKMNTSE